MRLIAFSAVLVAWLIAPDSVGAQQAEADRVKEVVMSVARYIEAGRPQALDTIYGSGRGLHIIEGSGVNHGWEDYRDHHLKPELESMKNLKYSFSRVEPQVRGDIAWASFRYELSADMERGHVEVEGRGTMVLEKTDGRWVIVHQHTSGRRKSNPPGK